jgi:hypothetical protein
MMNPKWVVCDFPDGGLALWIQTTLTLSVMGVERPTQQNRV